MDNVSKDISFIKSKTKSINKTDAILGMYKIEDFENIDDYKQANKMIIIGKLCIVKHKFNPKNIKLLYEKEKNVRNIK